MAAKIDFISCPKTAEETSPDRYSQAYLTCLCSDERLKHLVETKQLSTGRPESR
jgi:hypothetical protein